MSLASFDAVTSIGSHHQTAPGCSGNRPGLAAFSRRRVTDGHKTTAGTQHLRRDMHVGANIAVYEPPAALRIVTQVYAGFLLIAFALLPAPVIAYLYFSKDPALKFEDHQLP
jgi:hypothetical protein